MHDAKAAQRMPRFSEPITTPKHTVCFYIYEILNHPLHIPFAWKRVPSRGYSIILRIILIQTPLPHIPCHVIQPVSVGRILTYGNNRAKISSVISILGRNTIAPRVFFRASPPRAAFSHSASVGKRLPAHAA